MCGIFGSVNVDFDQKVLEMLRHRGPDGSGIIRKRISPHDVTLAHRRLSIIDLSSSGSQPMSTKDGRFTLVYNGEIYNHQELRDKVGLDRFSGRSDSESMLEYLAEFGVGQVCRLNGIFAFALLDRQERCLYLVRDPFGVKPIYYAANGSKLVFSSELAPILNLWPGDLDPAHLATMLRMRFSPSPQTLFRHIKKVKPGSVLRVDLAANSLKISESFYAEMESTQDEGIYADDCSEYIEKLDAAVNSQLMSDVEVGVLLSSGVDSALVAKMAQKNMRVPIKTFTVGFDTAHQTDECKGALETAQYIGTSHHNVIIGKNEFAAIFKKCVDIVEEPVATTSIIPMYYLSKLASEHVKVVLSGQGADELFGGYSRYRTACLANGLTRPVARLISNLGDSTLRSGGAFRKVLGLIGSSCTADALLASHEVFDSSTVARLTGVDQEMSSYILSKRSAELRIDRVNGAANKLMALDAGTNLPDDLLMYTDKITMHHSLECRVPFLDLRLAAFAKSLSQRKKVMFWRAKVLHRRAASRLLPHSIVNRAKMGFGSPADNWLEESMEIKSRLLDRGSIFSTYVNQSELESLIITSGRNKLGTKQLFLMLSLYFWMEKFLSDDRIDMRIRRYVV